jgi:hypothetical protein
MLNNAAVPAATGGEWTEQAVSSALKKVRKRTGPLYTAMLELCFADAMTPSECRPLLQSM